MEKRNHFKLLLLVATMAAGVSAQVITERTMLRPGTRFTVKHHLAGSRQMEVRQDGKAKTYYARPLTPPYFVKNC